jgi:hypothetical protein
MLLRRNLYVYGGGGISLTGNPSGGSGYAVTIDGNSNTAAGGFL